MADIEKTQLSNDDRALWNPYLSRAAEMVRALTNVERRNQKRRERTRQTVERRALGGPTVASWNGETNGDANVFERLRGRAERCRQQSGA